MDTFFTVHDEYEEYRVAYDAEEVCLWGCNLYSVPDQLRDCRRLRELDLSGGSIGQVRHLEGLERLAVLKLDGNRLRLLSGLPAGLRELSATNNQVEAVRAPPRLESLLLTGNRLRAVPRLPAGLRTLHLGDNPIAELEGFPAGLLELEVSLEAACSISLPRGLQRLVLRGKRGCDEVMTQLLAALPATLRDIDYEDCDFRLPVDSAVRSGAWSAPLEPRPAEEPFQFLPFDDFQSSSAWTETLAKPLFEK